MEEERVAAGRRMSEQREAEILAIALERLGARGYDGLTMDEVAAAARTSKATLYRQWQGKAGLVSAALQQFSTAPEAVDTGSLRGDLLAFATCMPAADRDRVALLAALVHVAQGDPALAALLRERLVHPNEVALTLLFEQAVRRGEVAADNALLPVLPHLLIYSVLGRILLDGLVPDEAYLVAMIDQVVIPLLGASGTPDRATSPPAAPVHVPL